MIEIHDTRICALGEGPLWHPERADFLWFDITGNRMLGTGGAEWGMGENASAAGWVDRETLLIATETALITFNLDTGARETVAPLEPENPLTRSNDGRADPCGGFWIGTMGKDATSGLGAIYRYYRGEIRRLFPGITVPNSMCFAPDGDHAFWSDTGQGQVMQSKLDSHGWPVGDAEVFLDLRAEKLHPDGAVVDADGNMWLALYGASRVNCYGPDAALRHTVDVPAWQTTCPAFGGGDLDTLLVTSAAQNLSTEQMSKNSRNGMTFAATGLGPGQREHQVIL